MPVGTRARGRPLRRPAYPVRRPIIACCSARRRASNIRRMYFEAARQSPGVRALRRGRCSLPNHAFHVVTRTHLHARWFESLTSARIVVRNLQRECVAHSTRSLAFVVMPDHLHWLVVVPEGRPLSVCVNSVKSLAARQINKLVGRHGKVWQKGFYDRGIRRDEDLALVARYIVMNPVRAGLVPRIGDYPHWDAVWLSPTGRPSGRAPTGQPL